MGSAETGASRGFSAGLKRLTRHSGVYALGEGLGKVLGFVLIPLVTRYIGARENYGVQEIAGVTLAVAAQALGINVLHGMTRYYAESEDEDARRRLVSTTLLLLAASTGIALAAGLVFARPLAVALFGGEEYADAVRAVAAILFFQSFAQTGFRLLQLLERSGTYVVIRLSKTLLEAALKVSLMVGVGLTYMGVLLPVVIGEALVGGGVLVWVLWRCRAAFSSALAGRLLRYSAPLVLSGLSMFVLHQADRYFVQLYHGLGAVGLYGLSYQLGYMVNALVFESFALIWFPFVFALREEERFAFTVRKVACYFSVGVTFLSLGAALFSREIVHVMAAPEFREAHTTVPWILLGYVFWAGYQIAATALYVRERTGVVGVLVLAAAAVNVALDVWWVPADGPLGAARATAATFAFLALTTWAAAERVLPVRYELGRVTLPVLLALALYAAGLWLVPDGPLGWSLAWKAGLCAAHPALLWFGGYFTPEERRRGLGFLRRKLEQLRSGTSSGGSTEP